jgi:hypothetical protein
MGSLCVAFFAACAIVAAVSLLPGSSYLELTETGFTFCSLYRKTFVPWNHVREFLPIRIHHNDMVGWNFAAAAPPAGPGRRFSASISGAEAGLPDTYGMTSAELAELLNAMLRRPRAEPLA